MTDQQYFRESMQLVIERAKALALRRTLEHRENRSQLAQQEKKVERVTL